MGKPWNQAKFRVQRYLQFFALLFLMSPASIALVWGAWERGWYSHCPKLIQQKYADVMYTAYKCTA